MEPQYEPSPADRIDHQPEPVDYREQHKLNRRIEIGKQTTLEERTRAAAGLSVLPALAGAFSGVATGYVTHLAGVAAAAGLNATGNPDLGSQVREGMSALAPIAGAYLGTLTAWNLRPSKEDVNYRAGTDKILAHMRGTDRN